jgi:hypothetical protein
MSAASQEIVTRYSCRLCNSNGLRNLFSLGEQYINAFPTSIKEEDQGIKCPIDVVICENCSLVQLRHTAPQELLYARHYWYKSGVTQTMRTALAEIAFQAADVARLRESDVVLDVGSNDGTLLRSFPKYCFRVGIEPATNLVEEGSQGIDLLINSFWGTPSAMAEYVKRVAVKASVVTAIGMMYDLEDPNPFIADVAKVLAPNGVFIAQLMCLKNMMVMNDIGNFCHEHLEYYSLKSLNYLLNKHGLELFDIQTNDTNGQSYRLFIQHENGSREKVVSNLERHQGPERYLDVPAIYEGFRQEMEDTREKVVNFINKEVAVGKKVWVYGASTKGNTILQYFGLKYPTITGAAERSPEKWNRYTVGSCIPIWSEELARASKPDYFLVLPYTFLQEFIRREQDWLRTGGKFIVPLPVPKLVSINGEERL